MKIDPEIRARLSLLVASRGVPSVLRKLVRVHGSGIRAMKSNELPSGFQAKLRDSVLQQDVDRQVLLAKKFGARWIMPEKSWFPFPTDTALLCLRGSLPTNATVSIVGARRADHYGIQIARSLSSALSSVGIAVVSGGAVGVDEAAHRSALSQERGTVAVLGTGLAGTRNTRQRKLQEDIVRANGAVVSEFLCDSSGSKWSFPDRNRLVASWGQAVVVIQASRKSGALITAKIAQEKGIPLYAVPGDVWCRNSLGSNDLIASNQAKLFQHPRDLVSVLGESNLLDSFWPNVDRKTQWKEHEDMCSTSMSDRQRIYQFLLKTPRQSVDGISEQSGVLKSQVAEVLFELEMDQKIRCFADNTYEVIQ